MLDSKGFDKWAGEYDQSISPDEKGYPFEGYYEVLDFMHRQVKISGNTRILDLGVGTGLLTYKLYKQGGQITGVDFSQKMIEQAQKKMPEAIFHQFDLSQGLPTEVEKQKFDYIVSSYAIHHLDDNEKIELIQKLVRLLAKNGQILIADIAFNTLEARELCKIEVGRFWDADEFYFVAEELMAILQTQGLKVQYTQVSSCAGVLKVTCE